MKTAWVLLAIVCALVIVSYAFLAQSPAWEPALDASQTYYNLLVRGFRDGQLNLKQEVPPALTELTNPYDPSANVLFRDPPYRMHDLSYYKGKLYLYWGVTPAVILFWPFAALTGHYLLHREAVTIFYAIGFLASVGLLYSLWRRYFAGVSLVVVMACVLALGFAAGAPVLLTWAGVYEVPISCGYMLTMLALGAIWRALQEPRQDRWLAAASVAYGLAVGARPSLLFGAVILLVPVIQSWRAPWPRKLSGLMAATFPIALIGLGLMLYNARRFDDPFEFGMHYQLTGMPLGRQQFFNPQYLWFHFRIYFLEPVRWTAHFPFVQDIVVPPLPPGHYAVGRSFGVLTNIPLVWLALAAPLAWHDRSGQAASVLRRFVTAVALLFGMTAVTIGLFFCAAFRYQVDFLPALVLLAVVGILGLERALANRPPAWRKMARAGWGVLLGFSVAFNILASVGDYTDAQNSLGVALVHAGRVTEAIGHYQQAVRFKPTYAEAHFNLGVAFARLGRRPEAIEQYEQALRIKPEYAEAHNNLATLLEQTGRIQEAIGHYQQALRFGPDIAQVHNNLGTALMQSGNATEATKQFEAALRSLADDPEIHNNLGTALVQSGNVEEAIRHYQQALQIRPDYAEAYYNLGVAFARLDRTPEAINYWEQALRLKPDYAEAHNNLGVAFGQTGKLQEAVEQCEQALRLKPDYAQAHFNLGIILERAGNVPEAVKHYQQALRIKPDLTPAQLALERLRARQ